jgi:UDP-N-acetylglucosamine:LPS N-acetylglucosamine transferase
MTAAKIEIEPVQSDTSVKKKILVLMSEGGGGHKIASYAMQEILSPYYDIEIVSVLPNIIHKIDYFTLLTSGSFTGDDFYNFLLRRGHHRAVSFLARMGVKYMFAKRNQIDQLFQTYLRKSTIKYDMVISTFPYVNCGLALAAQKLDMPFLVMPTDLDTATFFCGLSAIDFTKGGNFAFALPYDDKDLKIKAFRNFNLPKDKIHITGFPVRPGCEKKYTPEQLKVLKLKHGLRFDTLVLTLILGAAGNEMLYDYTLELSQIEPAGFSAPLEVNICVGRYDKMAKKIIDAMILQGATLLKEQESFTTLKTSLGVTFHIRKYMRDIIELMACSSLIITKTGSCSVNEGIYLGKKLLLDNTENSSARHLQWENFNVPFVRKHGLGDAFTELKELNPMIRVLLQEDLGHPVVSGAFPVPNFEEELLTLIASMVKS